MIKNGKEWGGLAAPEHASEAIKLIKLNSCAV